MNRLLAPSTNTNSTADRYDIGACDSHPWRLPRVGSDVVALSICDDMRSKPRAQTGVQHLHRRAARPLPSSFPTHCPTNIERGSLARAS